MPVGRRGGDHRKVAGGHERKLERTRNGGSREGEGIDVGAQGFEFVLDPHAEFVFLIDDQQPQILELDVFPHDLVRTDEDVDLPLGQVLEDGRLFLWTAETVQVVHPHRHPFEPGSKTAVVLESQDLRLTEAHVTAHQAVHRTVALHVGLHRLGRLELIGSILVNERSLQFVLQVGVRRKGISFDRAAGGIELDQVESHLLDPLLRPVLECLPRPRT